MVKGLVDLSFLMMGVGTKLGDEVHTGTLWDIGNKILQKLIKKRFEIGPTVIQCLTDRIIRGGAAVSQYTSNQTIDKRFFIAFDDFYANKE